MTAQLPPTTPLVGRFIRLEPLTRELLPELHAAIARPEVFAGGYGGGSAGLRTDPDEFAAWALGYYRFDRDDAAPYAIRLAGGPNDGLLVGTSSIADIELANEAAHIGWTAYDPRVWGTAVNPEAKLLLLGRLFDSGFGRVKIQADAANARSRAAITKLGATFEGVMRRAQPRADGSWRDTAVYSVLADEWPEVRAGLQERLAGFPDAVVLSEPKA
ncbi:GNAT family protein [Rathayibacter sp. YIM 133350]|uniref:GNAT family N-acetyltransferase n=1 Tax=Rathayibacter sp. YIM 133350 TaxID=3131992 RepID=UPI00307DFA39